MSFANMLRRVRNSFAKLCTSLGLYNRRLSHDEWFDLCAELSPSVLGNTYVILSEYYIYNNMIFLVVHNIHYIHSAPMWASV